MVIKCEYTNIKWMGEEEFYTCKIIEQKICLEEQFEFEGQAWLGSEKSHRCQKCFNVLDVTAIWFVECKISKIPTTLLDNFPNLEAICIQECELSSLRKNDISKYKNFRIMNFQFNQIDYLPSDLFENFENLEKISFHKNNLKFIEPKIFDGLDKLNYVDLRRNPFFDVFYSADAQQFANSTLQGIKNSIFSRFYTRFKFAQDIRNSNENLKEKVKDLTQQLKQQNEESSKSINKLKQEAQNIQKSHVKLKQDLESKLAESSKNVDKYQKEIKDLKKSNTDLSQKMQKMKSEFENEKADLLKNFQQERENWKKINEKLSYDNFILKGYSQQATKHLINDITKLIQKENFKDFKIIIDDREFPVHKFLLTARSPTLAEILRNNPEAENLKLVDISVEIFELILKFLYTDELPNKNGIDFLHLFGASGRLKIRELKNYAAKKLLETVNAENAIEILNLSNKYVHEELRQKAFEEIKRNYPKIEFKDEWIEDGEKMAKFIEAFKVREEMMKKAEEEFKKMLT